MEQIFGSRSATARALPDADQSAGGAVAEIKKAEAQEDSTGERGGSSKRSRVNQRCVQLQCSANPNQVG